MVGPLFFYDLIRLARRGRSTLLRTLYALALFGGLCLVYSSRFPQHDLLADPFAAGPHVSVNERARFAGGFVLMVLLAQNVAVLVLTPTYVAGAIAEEKERKTLELLFTTQLRDREIVLGKLLSRLAHLAGVLLAGLPVLCLMQFWGGVDREVPLAGFVVTLMTLLSVGSWSILCSVLCRDVLASVLYSYAGVCFVSLVCFFPVVSPLTFFMDLDSHLGTNVFYHMLFGFGRGTPSRLLETDGLGVVTGVYVSVHGLIALFCALVAIGALRGNGLPTGETSPARPLVEPMDLRTRLTRETVRLPSRVRYRIGDNALLWKEVMHGANEMAGWKFRYVYWLTTGFGVLLLFVLLVGVVLPRLHGEDEPSLSEVIYRFMRDEVNPFIRSLGILLMGAWGVMLGLRAATSITRERDQQTLDGLLTLPVERRELLRSKWLGSILRYRQLGYMLAAVWTVGLVSSAVQPLGLLLLVLACAVHIALLASVGVWLSLVSRNTLWANFTMALVLLLVFVGSWVYRVYMYLLFGRLPPRTGWWAYFTDIGLNPPRTWWTLAATWDGFAAEIDRAGGPFTGPFAAAVAGVLVLAIVALVFWWLAWLWVRGEKLHGGK